MATLGFNPNNVNLSSADPRDIICFLNNAGNEYNGNLGARVSALFVILIISTAATFFPVIAKRVPRFHIPLYVYLFARYFGAGVIVATAFIHLLDPAYSEIGPATCVGMTGGWASYSWPPAIVLASVMGIFLLDFGAERYVEMKYGIQSEADIQESVTGQRDTAETPNNDIRRSSAIANRAVSISEGRQEHENRSGVRVPARPGQSYEKQFDETFVTETDTDEASRMLAFQQQIAAFLILEFGVIVHSVIIGLNLGVAGSEFSTLYPVLVFHQSFEGKRHSIQQN